ncbi:hypothetical protein SNEBB_004409 [Seison nebaliae]|nr:hypothetical protein SNEBB_004409 [Seison nebaliae]
MWNTTKPDISSNTRTLLDNLMKEAKLSNVQRKEINDSIKNGSGLPKTLKSNQYHRQRQKPSGDNNDVKMNYNGKRRNLSSIVQSGAFQVDPYHSVKIPSRNKEKEKFSKIMEYGREAVDEQEAQLRRKSPNKDTISPSENRNNSRDKDDDDLYGRFDELTKEIEDRKNFLIEMVELGEGEKYRNKIETEISQRVREMQEIDVRLKQEMN